MARGIDTKCIHLEEDEGQCSHYGALSYPIYQTATYAHPGVGQSTGLITADCRTRPESIWRRWWLCWKTELMRLH